MVDDGSTDDTERIAAGFGNTIRYLRQPRRGPGPARNRGVKACGSDLIGFLDADDLWPKERLGLCLSLFVQSPSLQAAVGLTRLLGLTVSPEGGRAYVPYGAPFLSFNVAGWLLRRSVFDRVGFFDETVGVSEDADWVLRLREANLDLTVLDQVVLLHRRHSGNLTLGKGLKELGFLEVLKKSIDRRRKTAGSAPALPPLAERLPKTVRDSLRRTSPLVSVIIPVRNGERFLADAVRSVIEQEYRPLEIIIVDDGSTDGSRALLCSYPQARYIHQDHQGIAAARNNGVRNAHGSFLAFLDQDDFWTPGKLDKQVGYLLKNPEIGYVVGWQKIRMVPGTPAPTWLKRELLCEPHAGLLPGTMVVRREIFDRVGFFNAAYRLADDFDWFLRAKDAGVRMTVMPDIVLEKRIHEANQSHQSGLAMSELMKVLKTSIDRRHGR